MSHPPLVLLGAGRMGSALLEGWVAGDIGRPVVVAEPSPSDRLKALATGGQIALNPPPAGAGILALCVKPQVFPDILDTARAWIGPDTVVLSIMAGLELDQLANWLGTARVIRAMPNTPGAIGQGVTLVAPGTGADAADIEEVIALLTPLGSVEGPMTEGELSAATAISGCGPAYVFLLAEVLAAAGVKAGLAPDLAARIAKATVTGSAALMAASGTEPADLRKAVTSPNGVTQAALEVLMAQEGWPSLMEEAVRSAIARDKALAAEAAGK